MRLLAHCHYSVFKNECYHSETLKWAPGVRTSVVRIEEVSHDFLFLVVHQILDMQENLLNSDIKPTHRDTFLQVQ